MPLFITKINEASTSVSFQYLDTDHVFGILVSASYDFSILDVEFVDGEDNVIQGVAALESAYSRPNIAAKIGLDEFRNGIVTSISYDPTNGVRENVGSISIEERIKLTESDGVLSELFDNIPSQQDLESFSESLSFSRGANSYSYSRSISLKYKQDAGSQFFNKAYLFLKNTYLGQKPAYGFQEDGISENARFNSDFKPLISESYDEINKEVNFSENFESARIFEENGISFSKNQTENLSLNNNGYQEKRYRVDISALNEPLELNISSGISFSLQSLIEQNSGDFGRPVSIEKGFNSDGGDATLSVSFSNDPRRNSLTNIDYSIKKSSKDQYDSYDFSLKIKSIGPNKRVSFDNAKDYFDLNRDLAYEKIPKFFPEVTSGDLNEVSRNASFEPFRGGISENVSFSLDPSYIDNNDGVLKRDITVSDQKQVNRNTILPIYGDKEIVIKNPTAYKLGNRSVSINLTSASGQNLESQAILKASGLAPNEYSYFYLQSKQSSFEPLNGKSSSNLNFIFFE